MVIVASKIWWQLTTTAVAIRSPTCRKGIRPARRLQGRVRVAAGDPVA